MHSLLLALPTIRELAPETGRRLTSHFHIESHKLAKNHRHYRQVRGQASRSSEGAFPCPPASNQYTPCGASRLSDPPNGSSYSALAFSALQICTQCPPPSFAYLVQRFSLHLPGNTLTRTLLSVDEGSGQVNRTRINTLGLMELKTHPVRGVATCPPCHHGSPSHQAKLHTTASMMDSQSLLTVSSGPVLSAAVSPAVSFRVSRPSKTSLSPITILNSSMCFPSLRASGIVSTARENVRGTSIFFGGRRNLDPGAQPTASASTLTTLTVRIDTVRSREVHPGFEGVDGRCGL